MHSFRENEDFIEKVATAAECAVEDLKGMSDEDIAEVFLRSEVNSELNFPPNFEGLVLGCIDADFCK